MNSSPQGPRLAVGVDRTACNPFLPSSPPQIVTAFPCCPPSPRLSHEAYGPKKEEPRTSRSVSQLPAHWAARAASPKGTLLPKDTPLPKDIHLPKGCPMSSG